MPSTTRILRTLAICGAAAGLGHVVGWADLIAAGLGVVAAAAAWRRSPQPNALPPPAAPRETVATTPGVNLGTIVSVPPQVGSLVPGQPFWLGLDDLVRHAIVIGTTGTITQDAADFLHSEHGRAVLVNAAMKLLLKQDATTVDIVADAFQLTPEERQYLLGAQKGEGLLFARGARLPLVVESSPAEHRLVTTAPRELFDVGAPPGANGVVDAAGH